MPNKYHEHKMVRVDQPALRSARRLCIVVLVLAGAVFCYYLQASPATRALIDAYDTWPLVVVATFVALVTLRAIFSR
jgi:hypothetical protein